MTRRRSSASGRFRPDRRRTLPLLAISVALILAACGASEPSVSSGPGAGTPGPGVSAGPTGAPTGASPDASGPTASDEPSSPASEIPSDIPSEIPSEAPSSTAPAGDGPAAACAGSDANRDFYASVAAAVSWPVYCPVLGEGWHVDAGQYRSAGGGWMEIAYKGPEGARLAFRQGVPCTTDGCEPTGTDAGPAAFGDMGGRLLELDGGDLAVVVDPGASPSWSVVGSGLEQPEFEAIAAALVRVGD